MKTLLLVALAGLQIADGITTYSAIRRKKGREQNPIVNWFIERLGLFPGLFLVKGVGVVMALWLWMAGSLPAMLLLTVFYAYIVHKNYGIASNGNQK